MAPFINGNPDNNINPINKIFFPILVYMAHKLNIFIECGV